MWPFDYFSKNSEKIEEKSKAAEGRYEDISPLGTSIYHGVPGIGDLDLRDEPYHILLEKCSRHMWVYIPVSRIAWCGAQVDLKVIDKRRIGKPNQEATPAMGLVPLLERPNPWMSETEFMMLLIMHLLLTGNAYIEKAEIDGFGRPHELYLLNPKNMVAVPDRKNFISEYQYIVNNKVIHYPPSEIVHIKMPDPRGESRYGLSPLTAARIGLMMERAAQDWNVAYFNNATWPSGIITCQDEIGEDEIKRMRQYLKQNYQGKDKAGRVLILEGGLQWIATTPNPKDIDFLSLLRHIREDMLAIYGVPPIIAGVFQFENTTSRSAGVREQATQFWSNTVQPLMKLILSKFNLEITHNFSKNFEIVPDITGIPALRETEEMKESKAKTYAHLVKSGWSANAALGELYPHRSPFPWGEGPLPELGFPGIYPDDNNPPTAPKVQTTKPEAPVNPKPKAKPKVK